MLKIIYSFFLGLLLALFIGFGINTFYQEPKAPEFPPILNQAKENPTPAQERAQAKFETDNRNYTEKQLKPYSRNVSIIALSAAVLLMVISMGLEQKFEVLSNGIMLGGIFTLLYSIARGGASGNSKYMFISVTIGLIFTVLLGYKKFNLMQPTVAKKIK